MLTFPVEEWIGNAAAVLSGVWGAVTRRSEQSGYSRTAIYQHAERVVQVVANEQTGGMRYEELWAGNERLKAGREILEALVRHEPASKGVHDRRRVRDDGHQRPSSAW